MLVAVVSIAAILASVLGVISDSVSPPSTLPHLSRDSNSGGLLMLFQSFGLESTATNDNH